MMTGEKIKIARMAPIYSFLFLNKSRLLKAVYIRKTGIKKKVVYFVKNIRPADRPVQIK